MRDVASRMRNRLQVSTDGLENLSGCRRSAFGAEVDYAQIVKIYGHDERDEHRYRPSPK